MTPTQTALLRIVYLEDDTSAYELAKLMLAEEGLAEGMVHVETRAEFLAAIRPDPPDIILSDYNLPTIDGTAALELRNEHCPEVPFLFVSGALGEERAIESLRQGATDFVLKDSLKRLAPAVKRAISEAHEHATRMRAEQSLRVSEERFRRLAENAPDVIFRITLSPEGPMLDYLSPAAEHILGVPPAQLIECPALLLKRVHPADRVRLQTAWESPQADVDLAVLRWCHPDGRVLYTEQRGNYLRDARGNPIAIEGVARDITERREADAEIHLLSQAVAQSPVGVIVTSADGKIVFVNAYAIRVFEPIAAVHAGVDFWSLPFGDSGSCVRTDVMAALARDSVWQGDMALTKNGETRYLHLRFSTVHMADGGVHRLIVGDDVTERRRESAQRRELEKQLYHAQRLESIGTLASGVAHDFNNILTGILGFAELALMDCPPEADPSSIVQIKAAALRAKDLAAQILSFSRGSATEQQTLDLSRHANDALQLVRASMPSSIRLERHMEAANIRSDPTQIHQLVVNLCTNSIHAMGRKPGSLRVEVCTVDVDSQLAAELPPLQTGLHVMLRVSDTGHGMDATTLRRAFEAFYTTKREGEGTGLGLSLVQTIMARHNGAIRLLSTVGVGTTAEAYFPACLTPSATPAATPVSPRGHGQRILVVDDERTIAKIVAARLEQLGYSAQMTSDAREAMRRLAYHAESFDALVTDITMPHHDGLELIQAARAEGTILPVVVMSGFGDEQVKVELRAMPRVALLQKPFEGHDLAQALYSLLHADAPATV